MIDVEKVVFATVAKRLREEYPGIFVTGEYVKSPSSFPCVSIIEADNQVYTSTRTTDETENHALLLYEVNVYSNKVNGKKSECREIMALIDGVLARIGFTRNYLNPIPNEDDATIYRIVGRYKAVVSKENVIYRR